MKEGFKMCDKEYKLMKDFGELVPGMVFKSKCGTNLVVNDILNSNVISVYTENPKDPEPANWFTRLEPKVKLIYDPRVVKTDSDKIKEKISEHKKQIEILEKELEKESLKNVFKIGSVYRIENKNKEAFLINVTLVCDDHIWGCHLDGYTRKVMYSDISKVWTISDLKSCFWNNSEHLIFERKD